jgi:hypothetical protein
MNLSKILLLAVLALCYLSFSQKIQISYPENMPKEISEYINAHDYMIIVYHKVTGCTGCSVSELKPWGMYGKSFDKYKTGVLLVIRSTEKEENIRNLLKSDKIEYPCIFDSDGSFKTNNPVYEQTEENVIAVDKNKNVIFTGSPIKDRETWDNFMKRIKPK